MSWRMWVLAVLIVCVPGVGSSRAGGIALPEPLPADQVEAFLAVHRDADWVFLQDWLGLELRYDEEDQGLSGKQLSCREYAVQNKAAIAALSVVRVVDSPSRDLKKIEIIVEGVGGRRRWRRKDLKWVESTRREGGVVTLDGTVAQAFVPGLQVGDRLRIVEEYRLEGLHGAIPVHLGSSSRPYLESTYELHLPSRYEFSWAAQGGDYSRDRLQYMGPVDTGSGTHRWRLAADPDGELPQCRERYPYLKIVPHVLSIGDEHEGHMSFGTSWAEVGTAYLDRIEDVFAVNEEMGAKATELTQTAAEISAKIDLLYAWVQQRSHYLGLYEGVDGIIPKSAISVHDRGSGDCKGLATLLIGMLRSVGVSAHPVLVLTESGGVVAESVPNLIQFNHFIVWADDGGEGLFLDCTVDRYPAGAIPLRDTTSPVLLLKPGAVALVPIPMVARQAGSGRRTLVGHLDRLGYVHLDMTYTVTGALGRWWRNRLVDMDQQSAQKATLQYLAPDEFATRAGHVSLAGLEDWRAPLAMTVSLASSTAMPRSGDTIYLPLNMTQDMLGLDTEVVCGGRLDLRGLAERTVHWQLEMPADYSVVAPDTLTFDGPGLQWSRRLRQDGRTLHMERKLTFTRDFLAPAAADSLADLLRDIEQSEAGYLEVRCR